MCRSSRVTIIHFNSKTHWQMFLLLYDRHFCAPLKDKNMASPYKAVSIFVTHFLEKHTKEKQQRPGSWWGCLYLNHLSYPRILTLFIEWLRFLVLIPFSFLARISSKERASVKISSSLCVDFCGNTVMWGSCYFSSHCVVFLAKTKTQEGCATKSLNNGLYWTIRILKKTT